MNSKEYWRDRETENQKKYLKKDKEYLAELNDIYKYTMNQVQKEIDSFYAKYANKEGITIAEARKRASKLDMEEYSRKAKKYVAEKNFSKQANEEMRLYNMTMKVNRLELLKAQIGLELVAGFDEMQEVYDNALNERTQEELMRQAGILGYTILDNAKMANAIVNASFHNATYSERIWMHQDLLRVELDKLLRTGLIQGRNPRELARGLRKVFDVSRYNSERLMITELARVQTGAQQQSFIRNGFDEYQFVACSGRDVCPICKDLGGKHFKVEDMMPGENAPPMHPLCHCSTAAYIDDKAYNEWLNGYKEHGLSFAEWKVARRDILNKNYKQLSLEEFKKIHHNISKEERKILYGKGHFSGYINSHNARKLNGLLRNGDELTGDYKEIADTLSRVIQKNAVPDDIIVTRFVDTDALEFITGVAFPKSPGFFAKKDEIEQYWEDIGDLKNKISKGHLYVEKGFLSTSGVADKNVFTDRDIEFNIKVPKGTNAYITTNYKESEIIFDRNTTLEIIDVRIENNKTANVKVILDCIVR